MKNRKFYFIDADFSIKDVHLIRNWRFTATLLDIKNSFLTREDAQDCLDNYIKPAYQSYWEDKNK